MDHDQITVRPATRRDAASILDMARELAKAVKDPPPRINLARFLEDGWSRQRWFDCFIAGRDGAAIGYALACRAFEAHTGQRRLWLGDLYVRPEARRSGAGHSLMSAVARHALKLRCDAVYWELWCQNSIGETFYRTLEAEAVEDLAIFRLGAERLAALAHDDGRRIPHTST